MSLRFISSLLVCAAASASGSTTSTTIADNGLTNYESRSVFAPSPTSGATALLIRVSGQGQNDPILVKATSSFSSYYRQRTEKRLDTRTVIADASAWQPVVVPIIAPMTNSSHSGSHHSQFSITAEHRNTNVHFGSPAVHTSHSTPQEVIDTAISEGVQAIEKASSTTVFSSFSAENLPADWRAYTGFRSITLTGKEWRSLPLPKRQTMLEYVHLGGQLQIFRPEPDTAANLNMKGAPSLRRGLGSIVLSDSLATGNSSRGSITGSIGTKPGLSDEIPDTKDPGTLTFLGVLALGILIGPLNLFIFTRKHRHRLFFTIPVIAASASIVFVVAILMEDGIGGDGKRFAVITLSSDTSSAAVLQQQSSRCGALLATSFELPEKGVIYAIDVNEPSYGNRAPMENISYTSTGKSFSGDWFSSRKKQVFTILSVVPSRNRLELQPTGEAEPTTRTVTNTTASTLENIAYIDNNGRPYKFSGSVAPGSAATLTACSLTDACADIRKTGDRELDKNTLESIIQSLKTGGQIVATSSNAPELCTDTLNSIDWKTSKAIIIQPIAE